MEILVNKLVISSLNPSVCQAMLFFVVETAYFTKTWLEQNNICKFWELLNLVHESSLK